MNITVMRIDDRLIHGQIVTQWITYANAKTIWVVDDKASEDTMEQMILKLAVPNGVNLEILSKTEAIAKWEKDKSNTNILLLMRNPKEVEEFMDLGFKIDKINLGNISNSRSKIGRKKILDFLYFEPQDAISLQSILQKGVEIEAKTVPNEKGKNCQELLKKYENS